MTPTQLLTDLFMPDEGFYESEVESPGRLPVLTFLPTGFEPRYAYPLLVFLHGRGSNEKQLMRLAPRVSRRNYISIGLRGPESMRRFDDGENFGFGWGDQGSVEAYAEEYVFNAIEQACMTYPIHEERVYLAGICEGAAMAYRIGLAYPDKFAGIIALNGQMPAGGPLLRLPELRRLRILVGHGIANATIPLSVAKKDHRLLWTAGAPIELRTYPTTHRIHLDMLRDINHWVMDGVSSAAK
jgi:phospholipase/carboxylesterase